MLSKSAIVLVSLLASCASGYKHPARNPSRLLHVSRQPGLNTKPPSFTDPYLGTGAMRRRDDPTYNQTTICDPNSPASSFKDMQCVQDSDCASWLEYHGEISLYQETNVNSGTQATALARCVQHKCIFSTLLNEGDQCQFSNDLCSYPFTCNGGTCNRPFAGGCGDCTEDASTCLYGTLCSSLTATCAEYLNEGDQCVYKVPNIIQTSDGTINTFETVVYPCGVSQTRYGELVVPSLFCNFQTGNCESGTVALSGVNGTCNPNGKDSDNYGCQAGLYCSSGTCLEYQQQGDDCTDMFVTQQCAPNLRCDTESYTCKALGSVPNGATCGTVSDASELCQPGLACINGACAKPLAVGETCSADNSNCVSGSVCDGTQCVLLYSAQAGDQCIEGASICDFNLDCVGGVCVEDSQPANCDQPGMCITSDGGLGSCLCSQGNSSCLGLNPSDASTVKQLYACMAQTAATPDNSFASWDVNPKFYALACCALCSSDTDAVKSVFDVEQINRLIFAGLNGTQLDCSDPLNPKMVPRSNNWCSSTADYGIAGGQSLARCPNATPYKGLPLEQRGNATDTSVDSLTCAADYCNNQGVCTAYNPPTCKCNQNFVGESCQYNTENLRLEQKALQALYSAATGSQWVEYSGWNTQNYCAAAGVTCNQYGFVTALRLAYFNARGTITPALSQLQQLQVLDLSGNFLVGTIPEELCQITTLQEISLSNNFLNGSLPDCLFTLPNLAKLKVNMNRLSGQLPGNLGKSTAFHMDFSRNSFTGALPLSLAGNNNIISIDFTNNHLDATENLPGNICGTCPRFIEQCNVFGCSKCSDGQILSCYSPSKITTAAGTPPTTPDGSLYPDECAYFYG